MPEPVIDSVLTCPECGVAESVTMPAVSCQITYRCLRCGIDLWPAPGDCCVFCTYGSVPCPAV
jgi:hypothetical protein